MEAKALKSHKSFEGLTQFWEHDSASTKTKMKFSTFLPEGKVKGCLIWLSGLTCRDENFITKAGAQRYLSDSGLMVICPDTSPRGLDLPREHDADDFGSGAGFYLNATTDGYRDHYRMSDYISEELHTLVQKQFSIDPRTIAISGHSMGGHGALTLGLRFPEKFCSISAFSPIVNPNQAPWGQKAFTGYLGDDHSRWNEYDATELIKAGRRHPKPMLVDQGLADPFLKTQLLTENFMEACQKARQPNTIHMRDGYDHSYYFVSTFIGEHVNFHSQAMS